MMKFRNVCMATFVAWASIGCSDDDSEAFGEGTEKSPYRIWCKEQLVALADSAAQGLTRGCHYVQVKDIDLDGNASDAWNPIGYYDLTHGNHRPFQGVYDGGGHKITGLYIHNECDSTVGLFGFALDAEIRNLTVAGDVYSSAKGVAGICGYFFHGTLENCENQASVYSATEHVGGVCGYFNGCSYIQPRSNIEELDDGVSDGNHEDANGRTMTTSRRMSYVCDAFLKNCTNKGTVIAAYRTGGICGLASMVQIKDCENSGKVVSVKNSSTGGICGALYYSPVLSCKNTGDVLANAGSSDYIGGIVGHSYDNECIISYCENKGNVQGRGYVGGICGYGFDTQNCINEGLVQGESSDIGGICGYGRNISDCINRSPILFKNGTNIGGICGFNNGKTYNCINYGNVGNTKRGTSIGGICGEMNYNVMINCCNYGDVYGSEYVGGLYGGMYENPDTLINVYNMGTVFGNTNVGGIGGYIRTMEVGYNMGKVTSNGTPYGLNERGNASYVFWSDSIAESGSAGTMYNCSAFNASLALATPAVVNGTSCENLLTALNAAVELYKTDFPDLKSWKIVSGENNGYPVFE